MEIKRWQWKILSVTNAITRELREERETTRNNENHGETEDDSFDNNDSYDTTINAQELPITNIIMIKNQTVAFRYQ